MKQVDREARAVQQVRSILRSQNLGVDDVDRALEAAMGRRGSPVGERERQLGIEATELILANKPLTDEHRAHLQSIIIGQGLRPAIDIENDAFDPLPDTWNDVNAARERLTPLIKSVGRVDVTGHPRLSFAGTAFACGPNLLLTNRHVAEEFMRADAAGARLTLKPGMTARVDTKQEVESAQQRIVALSGEAVFSTHWDVAALPVAGLPPGLQPLPLASAPPASVDARTAVTIGYPAFDDDENPVDQVTIFRNVFDKKRLLPGKFVGTFTVQSFGHDVQSLAHDCTTLGGNSGSAVIDVATARAFGVHFLGDPGVRNYCVPTWALLEDPAFATIRGQMSFA